METKYFIHGKVDWFKKSIQAPDSFEEGNMANISPTIKINISTYLEIVEEITLGVLQLIFPHMVDHTFMSFPVPL